MASLPESEIYLLVRTFFGHDAGWDALRETLEEGSAEGFRANVEFVDDRRFDGLSPEALVAIHPHRADGWDVMYVADEHAIMESTHPLLVVRVGSPEDVPFRCRADALHEVDANLSLANLDWDDLRDQTDDSGAYGDISAPSPQDAPHQSNAAVDVYRTTSDELVTISWPTVPENLWADIWNDLREAPDIGEHQSKEVRVIAEQILRRYEDDPGPVREQLEDPAVVTLPARDWAFIRERARRLTGRSLLDDGHDDGRPYGDGAAEIVQLISRHLP